MSTSITDPLMVAVLVKNLKDIREAAALVEQYGRTVAAAAVVDATLDASNRILNAIGAEAIHAPA